MASLPEVSVIIPALNRAQYLGRAVRSVWAAATVPTEVLIVDDGSTDGTRDVAKRLASSSPGTVRVLCHANGARRGVSASRNLGIRESRGEFIAFLDADDEYLPDRFGETLTVLRDDPGIDGVYGHAAIRYEDDAARALIDWGVDVFGIPERPTGRRLVEVLAGGQSWHVSAVTVRRTLIERCGWFREDMAFAEDCQYWLRMAIVGNIKPLSKRDPVSVYWRHATNTYSSRPERRVDMVRALVSASRPERRGSLASGMGALARRGAERYLLKSVVALREQGESRLALLAIWVAIREGGLGMSANRAILRQLISMLRRWMKGSRVRG